MVHNAVVERKSGADPAARWVADLIIKGQSSITGPEFRVFRRFMLWYTIRSLYATARAFYKNFSKPRWAQRIGGHKSKSMRAGWMILVGIGLLGPLGAPGAEPSLYITEASAREDWVEIYNPGPGPVDLSQWTISDTANTAALGGSLPPGKFQVIWLPFGLAGGERVGLSRWNPGTGYTTNQVFNCGWAPDGFTYGFPVVGNVVLTNLPTTLWASPGVRNGEPGLSGTSPLAITEILFRPILDNGNPDDGQQFVEVRNVSAQPLDLTGYWFSEGISFSFPSVVLAAGGYAVVVMNRAAFEFRHGTDRGVLGEFAGRLSIDGERLTVRDRSGAIVTSVKYEADWDFLAMEQSFSLVLRDESRAAAEDDPAAWRHSSQIGGSPGRPDPTPAWPRVVINEILSRPELPYEKAIEIANLEAVPVDISGWYLSDRSGRPKKFRLPAGTIIEPYGFLPLDEHTFNPDGDNEPFTTFTLNPIGEEIWLFSADASGTLTGYAHGFEFEGSDPNVSFGRQVDSVGREHFVAQSRTTWGEANPGPRASPLVISEIHYTGYEFIELHNQSGEPLALFDPASPTGVRGRWALSGAVSAQLPPMVVPADGRILVTGAGLSPDYFRTDYHVPAEVPIFQWGGGLRDRGESIRLVRLDLVMPDDGTTNALVSNIVMDEVDYLAGPPWPSASTVNVSLHRRFESLLGSDPGNWTAAGLSPGQPWTGGEGPVIVSHPQPVAAVFGGTATFTVEAAGTGTLSYQWTVNGYSIGGATGAVLHLGRVDLGWPGMYACVVANEFGAAQSRSVALSVPEFPLGDVAPPEVVIEQPAASSSTVSGPIAILAGTVSDDGAVAAVLFRRNGAEWFETAVGTNQWTISLVLTSAVTRVEIVALDRAGHVSPFQTREIRTDDPANRFPAVVSVRGEGNVMGVTNGQLLRLGERYSVSAVPAAGHYFVRWTDGSGRVLATEATWSFAAGERVVLVAEFAANPVITLHVEGAGTIVGLTNGQRLNPGTLQSVSAVPMPGSIFDRWTDGSGWVLWRGANYSFIASSNLTLVAHFVPDPGLVAVGLDVTGDGVISGLTNGQTLRVGRKYTVEARPGRGQIFVNWTDAAGNSVSAQRRYSFVAGSPASFTAHFVPANHFDSVRGSHLSIFADLNRPDHQRNGSVAVTVGRAGRFSGRVRIGAEAGSFSGGLDTAFGGRAVAVLSDGTSLPIELKLAPTVAVHTLRGTLETGGGDIRYSGQRLVAAGAVSSVVGTFAFAPGPLANDWGTAPSRFALTVRSSGRFTLTGLLPDGTPVRAAGVASTGGFIPVHALLERGQASVVGWLLPAPIADNTLIWSRTGIPPVAGFTRSIRFGPALPP